jgi:hypothetical protein
MGENAARQIGVEFLLAEQRQIRAQCFDFGGKRRIVRAHQPVERSVLRAAALVTRIRRGGFARAHNAHGDDNVEGVAYYTVYTYTFSVS